MNSLCRPKRRILNNILFIIFALVVLIYTVSSFYPTFKNDDDISMGLTMHNFANIIRIDSTDVHPPLYYLVLKLFLQATTFWTKSMVIKVIMARVLSAIFIIGTIYVLGQVVTSYSSNISWKWLIVTYLLVPGMINKLVKIRMYSISSFFLAIELYGLVKFFSKNKNRYLIIAILGSILASYCLYPTAISAGLFLLLYFVYGLMLHRKGIYKVFLSGITLIISYIPWIPILFNQFEYHSKGDVINNLVNLGISRAFLQSLTQLIFPTSLDKSPFINIFIIVISILALLSIIAIIIYILTNNSKSSLKNLFILILINFILTISIVWIACGINYQPGVIYPIFSIFFFIIMYYLTSDKYLNRYIILILLSIFSIYALGGTYYNVKSFDQPSIALINNYHKWNQSNDRFITVKTDSALEALQDSVYLKSINKNIVIKGVSKKNLSIDAFDDTNYKPVKALFNNIDFHK